MIASLRTSYTKEVLTHHADICAAMQYLTAHVGPTDVPVFMPANGDVGQDERPGGLYALEDIEGSFMLYVASNGECATITNLEQGARLPHLA